VGRVGRTGPALSVRHVRALYWSVDRIVVPWTVRCRHGTGSQFSTGSEGRKRAELNGMGSSVRICTGMSVADVMGHGPSGWVGCRFGESVEDRYRVVRGGLEFGQYWVVERGRCWAVRVVRWVGVRSTEVTRRTCHGRISQFRAEWKGPRCALSVQTRLVLSD
jgi:hypothetical protein